MPVRKQAHTAKAAPSKGAVLVSKYRARANRLSDEERLNLRANAMSLIYGNQSGNAAHTRSR